MTVNQASNMDSSDVESDQIRELERERLRVLVAADIDRAGQLHTDDFQLINPAGRSYSKSEYLGDVAAGVINYHVWQPETIAVRLHGDAAIVRYQAEMEITVAGQSFPLQRLWHTDVYERREESWQVVWSQATRIQQP